MPQRPVESPSTPADDRGPPADRRGRSRRWPWAVVAWGPLVAYSVAIFVVSSGPLPERLRPRFLDFLGSDKLGHLAIYAVWGALAAWARLAAWPGAQGASRRGAILFGWIGGTLYGLTDEIHQLWVPGRDAEAGDLVADSLGALAGAAAIALLWSAARRRRGSHERAAREPAGGIAGSREGAKRDP